MSGRYVVLEGGEGAGKSTQAARLAARLDAVLTREPGGTAIGSAIRSIVLDPAEAAMGVRTEALLMAADRAQLVAEVIAPALAMGRHVVSDRSLYSTIAYQGYGRELPVDEIRSISAWAINGTWPDLVVLLDLDPARAGGRLKQQLDRMELADARFHQRVRGGFLALAEAEPERFVVIDATLAVDEVSAFVDAAVAARLGLPGAGSVAAR